MTDPIFLERQGHRTWLKWHRAKRRISDPVFTGRRILEGMKLGASIEVDLVIHADRGYAVLHDLSVERETNGTGKVADLSAETLRSLHLRGEDGTVLDDKVMLLEDLTALLAEGGLHPDSILQLDYKEDWRVLDPQAIARFKAAVSPVAPHMILSSGDAEAVRLLTDDVPGIKIGYDPCHGGALDRLRESRDYAGFVRSAVAASPKAKTIYLHFPMILDADQYGFDIIAAFQAANRTIDAYTIRVADAETRPQVHRLLELRVDQITTDDPEGLMALAE
ncbi:glycerophosphodiester phosphodiesterase [Devosia epidermidihirudinis]|uniref:Glycerophosphodiester phosphodiesterase n=1 Tax=Devosia epidermidihirudinis TaxID=1293439 RepID=A0A0F5QFZ3_9HYPH|nr:glycerophosphodiester phosphodiesterase family protein [Devosia epidermidihirudinis]KKC39651.1 glycerophosphodiester phosphodiesterase [Devosia epidermidihirudinis]